MAPKTYIHTSTSKVEPGGMQFPGFALSHHMGSFLDNGPFQGPFLKRAVRFGEHKKGP